MNEMRVASRAFAAYFASSAERLSTATIGASRAAVQPGRHRPPPGVTTRRSTTRSGCRKSWTAVPCRMNSGLDTTSIPAFSTGWSPAIRVGCTDWNSALDNNERSRLRVRDQRLHCLQHVARVGRTVLPAGGRDRDKDEGAFTDLSIVATKPQTTVHYVFPDKLGETRLMDRQVARLRARLSFLSSTSMQVTR